ncbi:MAG TPA: capsule biosynthesis protein, partial [Tabrizicola sp.]
MTTTPKVPRYNTRPVDRASVQADDPGQLFDNHDDGFGSMDFRRPEDRPQSPAPTLAPAEGDAPASPESPAAPEGPASTAVPKAVTPEEIAAVNAAILTEGLTERQLKRAMIVAQRSLLEPTSEADAVRLLREAGVDPFSRASILRVVRPSPEPAAPPPQPARPAEGSAATGREIARLPGDVVQLPKKAKPIAVPSTEHRAEVNQAAEILRMQQDIARRRRRRLALLAARLFAFVLLPTLVAGWYFYMMATPMYAVRSEFVIQQAGPSGGGGSLGGLFSGTAFATSQDSIAVQGYLQSREAMARLDADLGFRAH